MEMSASKLWRYVACLPLTAVLLALPALGAEMVVKNDSIVDNGQAVIVGDFIIGERAGARLTASCNGTIVAVQILWLEGTAGHGDTLENAIYIYDGSTFPTPGTQLAFLEGPVLSPGVWNEFRYLDEAGTIPINVPVVAGQQFFVALEFGEPTEVGSGGPSVVRDTNGCQAGKNVLFAIPGGWMNFCLVITGDLAIRAVIDCQEATGACCVSGGICLIKTPTQCSQAAGTYKGDGTTCSPNPCPPPTGACCLSNGNCLVVSSADCLTLSGTWLGAGTACNGSLCPLGACCFPNGTCQVLTSAACATGGGTYQGTGTNCSPNNCPQPSGACCLSNGNCLVMIQTNCGIAGGTWAGGLTTCVDSNNSGRADVCEPAIHHGDVNCDGVVSYADINAFVLALTDRTSYYSRYPLCNWLNADCSGDGLVSYADINPFVALLAQGGG
jgi:hypothetical protein